MTGNTTSFDFPWEDNFQPFNGDGDAFVAKLDSTAAGAASLLYASPLGGTAGPGVSAIANGNAIAADGIGHIYLAGRTTAADFPRAGSAGNGFQLLCTSCQLSPVAADAFVVAIQEDAVAAPSASFSLPKISFGQETIGAQNIPLVFAAVSNTGDAPLNVASLGIVGPNSPDFAVVLTGGCMTAPILPGATCSFEVGFQPSIVGPEEAFMTFTDDAPGSPQLLQIEGIGGGPLAVPSPLSEDFGSVQVGSSSSIVQMSLINAGNQSLTISAFALRGQGASQFTIQDFTCTPSTVVPPKGNCFADMAFRPSVTGVYTANIEFTDNSAGAAGAQQVIPITGTGTVPAPQVNLLPRMLTFGQQPAGTTSVPQAVTLTNAGGAALTLIGVAITGTDAASFEIGASAGNNPCPMTGGTLAINAACTVAVNFSPQTSGAKSAALSFTDNASGSPQSVALTGTGIAPMIQISVPSLNFPSQSVGTGASQTVNITSTGNSPVGFNSITFTGPNAGDFSQTNACIPSIGAQGSCIISVTFNPIASGNRSAALSIFDNAPGSPQTVGLTGVATEAGILVSPASINFSGQLVGVPSAQVPINITNTGQGTLVINPISPNSFTGANAADFAEKDNCSGSIAPGGGCKIQVIFTPSCENSPVARTAALTLADNAPGKSQTILLTGTATGSFCIAPPPGGATSATVMAGQTATYQLDVISMNGFTGSVGLSCSGAPPESQCTATPATASAAVNSPTPFQVTVSTTATSQTLSPEGSAHDSLSHSSTALGTLRELPTHSGAALSIVACMVLGGLLASARRKITPKLILSCASLALVASAASNCGGNSTQAPSIAGTPPGSSALNVSAISTTASNASTLTLRLTVTQTSQ